MVQCDDNSRGVLIDFDMSIPVNASGTVSIDADRSGCLPFLARDLLQEKAPLPSYIHDLESFLWVLWWVGVGNHSTTRTDNPLMAWYTGTWVDMQQIKSNYINYPERYVYKLSPQHKGLAGWIIRLSGLFRDLQAALTQADNYTVEYEHFISILESDP